MAFFKKIKSGFRSFIFEVVVIIIGVLLSLAISNWVQGRKDNRKEQDFLEQIRQDLQDDLVALEQGLDFRARQLNFVATSLAKINNPDQEVDVAAIAKGLQVMLTVDIFEPSNVTFRSLESTGQLGLIDNEELIKGLIDLYTNAYASLRLNTDDVNGYRNRLFMPYVMENFDLNGAMSRGEAGNVSAITQDPVFQNHLVYYQISLFSTQGAYKRVIEELKKVLGVVEEELS